MKRKELIPALFGLMIAIPISVILHMWREPAPIEIYHRQAMQDIVHGGDVVRISWEETRMSECDSISYRRLIAADNAVVNFEPTHYPAKPAGVKIEGHFDIKIPTGLRQGPLIYRVYTDFRCNIVQRLLGGHRFIMPDIIFDYRRDGS